ncbi:MAG: hypothetical protein HY200_01895 [Nitrospirae bacterium]|nr:hypothetical protein [Nitrospirota bacterium]
MTRTFSELKHLIGTLESSPLRETWPCPDTDTGLPKGAITEICGAGKTEFVVQFLREHSDLSVAWVEPDLSIYPTGLLQRKVQLNRILFIEAENEFPWVVQQLFKSNLFEIVILFSTLSDPKMLRRFQLSAEKAHASLILLSEVFSKGWPVALQLKSSRKEGGRIHVDLIRKR